MAVVKSPAQRRLHKALLRYHDPDNWPLIRKALKQMKLEQLIGSGPDKLVPREQPRGWTYESARRKNTKAAHQKRIRKGRSLTQHTGLPPK